jgi:hypothetical protein
MSDGYEFEDLSEPDWPGHEWPDPYEETDKRLGDGLDARHTHAEIAAKEHAKEALEEVFENDFPINDPPESWERYETEVTLRHLRQGIVDMLAPEVSREQHIHYDGEQDSEVVAEMAELPHQDVDVAKAVVEARVEQAKQRIDVMATYGEVAEPHLAALTYSNMHSEVRAYATEALAKVREEKQSSKSLSETIRDWFRGGG